MGALDLTTEQRNHWLGEDLTLALENPVLRFVGVASLVVGVTAAGLLVGRELRFRYKFKRRTPSDFFSKAGEALPGADYGMGI